MSDKKTCAVCNEVAQTFVFGVPSCRACLAFYRRSQGRNYACRRNNSCNILKGAMRTTCRACRLRRCYKAGMPLMDDDQSTSSSIRPSECVNSLITLTPQTSPEAAESPSASGLLSRFLLDFRNINRAQRSMHAMENSGSVFVENQFVPITRSEYKRMEAGTLALMDGIIREKFSIVGVGDVDRQNELMSTYFLKYSTIYQCFLTSSSFPTVGDCRLATHYGGYVSPDKIDVLFEGEEHIRHKISAMLMQVLSSCLATVNKFRSVKLREIEAAALAGVMMWHDVEHRGLLDSSNEAMREEMNSELHSDLVSTYGYGQGGARLVQIISLVEDILSVTNTYAEMQLMVRVFPTGSEQCDPRYRVLGQ